LQGERLQNAENVEMGGQERVSVKRGGGRGAGSKDKRRRKSKAAQCTAAQGHGKAAQDETGQGGNKTR
jgi:hypothetical protein